MHTASDLLSKHDIKDAYEFPPDFDQGDLETRAAVIHGELERELGRSLLFEGGIYNQDASFSVAIRLTEKLGASMTCVCDLRFSNFGSLVAVTNEDYDGSAECMKVFEIARRHGFIPIPHDALDRDYDGINGGVFRTWWIRYFDWL